MDTERIEDKVLPPRVRTAAGHGAPEVKYHKSRNEFAAALGFEGKIYRPLFTQREGAASTDFEFHANRRNTGRNDRLRVM